MLRLRILFIYFYLIQKRKWQLYKCHGLVRTITSQYRLSV